MLCVSVVTHESWVVWVGHGSVWVSELFHILWSACDWEKERERENAAKNITCTHDDENAEKKKTIPKTPWLLRQTGKCGIISIFRLDRDCHKLVWRRTRLFIARVSASLRIDLPSMHHTRINQSMSDFRARRPGHVTVSRQTSLVSQSRDPLAVRSGRVQSSVGRANAAYWSMESAGRKPITRTDQRDELPYFAQSINCYR